MKNALRAIVLAAAAFGLTGGSSCDDNLGDAEPGPTAFRVSIAKNTTDANGASYFSSSSADGRYVAFTSRSTNLAPCLGKVREVFVRDRVLDTTENITRMDQFSYPDSAADCDFPSISRDGRYVVFTSFGDMTGGSALPYSTSNAFRFDRVTRVMDAVFPNYAWPDGDVANATVSDDGMKVAFESTASNLGAPSNGARQIYVADFNGGNPPPVTLISHADGAPATPGNLASENPMISGDGNFVVYRSRATTLTADATGGFRQIFISATDGSTTELVSRDTGAAGAVADNHCTSPAVSRDGTYVCFAFQGGNLGAADLPNARFPVLLRARGGSPTTTLVASDMFMFALFGPADGDQTRVSDDGRFVVYSGITLDLTDIQIWVRDMQGGSIAASKSVVPPGGSLLFFPTPSLSPDGRWVFWHADATTQVLSDNNGASDVFGYGPLK